MLLVAIVVLLGLALWLVRSLLRPEPVRPPPEESGAPEGTGALLPWHSDGGVWRPEVCRRV
jgi:hypothetical protein